MKVKIPSKGKERFKTKVCGHKIGKKSNWIKHFKKLWRGRILWDLIWYIEYGNEKDTVPQESCENEELCAKHWEITNTKMLRPFHMLFILNNI